MLKLVDGALKLVDEPALTAINMRLRDDYVRDCEGGIRRWNKVIEKSGVKFELKLPSVAFNRQIGEFKDIHASPDGELLSDGEWAARKDQWLPSRDDGAFIESLMAPCWEPRQVRILDRAAQSRRRQQGRRLRIREDPPGMTWIGQRFLLRTCAPCHPHAPLHPPALLFIQKTGHR